MTCTPHSGSSKIVDECTVIFKMLQIKICQIKTIQSLDHVYTNSISSPIQGLVDAHGMEQEKYRQWLAVNCSLILLQTKKARPFKEELHVILK